MKPLHDDRSRSRPTERTLAVFIGATLVSGQLECTGPLTDSPEPLQRGRPVDAMKRIPHPS